MNSGKRIPGLLTLSAVLRIVNPQFVVWNPNKFWRSCSARHQRDFETLAL
jgi:hypothetical protein